MPYEIKRKKRRNRNKMKKWVYSFSELDEVEDYIGKDWEAVRALLGHKGANLADMVRGGLPVPPGFTVTTEACNVYLSAGDKFPEGMWEQEMAAMEAIEKAIGKGFGDPKNPLLVSCRSSSKFSMPGMMDAVSNIGLNDRTAQGMIALTGNERFVYDAYRRFVQTFGSVVMGVSKEEYLRVLEDYCYKRSVASDSDLGVEDLEAITTEFKIIAKKITGQDFPTDPYDQLKLITAAVFKSWSSKRAHDYRNASKISRDLGSAVNIMAMVFGNMGSDSGTGVAFTRSPSTGEEVLYGEYLRNSQSEDVFAGIRKAQPIIELREELPEVYGNLQW